MTLRARLKALEQVKEGGGVEVWWMVDGRPGYYSRLKDDGEPVAVADLPACPPGRMRILVDYVDSLSMEARA